MDEAKYSEMKIEQAAVRSSNYCETVFTDFLTPREQLFASKQRDVSKLQWGGYEEAERKICAFKAPEEQLDISEFPLAIIEIDAGKNKLTHPEVLGSVLGLGLKREKTGDIIINGTKAYLIVSSSISDYILSELRNVGKNSIMARITDHVDVPDIPEEIETLNVPSLRLDAIVSDGLHIARTIAKELIESERVMVNFALAEKCDMRICEGDIISIRGHGRIVVDEISPNLSKKGRIFLKIKKKTRK